MQKRYFTSFNKIFVNIITIAADIVSFSYTFQKWYPSFAKPLVSHPKTLGFTSWNPCFHNLKPMLSDCNLMPFRRRIPYCIFMHKMHPHFRQYQSEIVKKHYIALKCCFLYLPFHIIYITYLEFFLLNCWESLNGEPIEGGGLLFFFAWQSSIFIMKKVLSWPCCSWSWR